MISVEREAVEEFERVRRAHLGDVVDGAFVHRDGEDLGLQALAAAGRARNDGEVAGQLLALSVGLSLLVAALHCGQRSLPLDVPVRLATVHRDVVDAHLVLAQAVQKPVLRLLRHILPRGVGVGAEVRGHGAQHLRVVVAGLERRDGALVQRQRRVGHHQRRVHLLAAADAEAVGAGAIGCVEREVARLQLVHGVSVLGACQREREDVLPRAQAARRAGRAPAALAERLAVVAQHLHEHAPVGQLRGQLHRLGDAARRARFKLHAVHHHVDEVLDLLVERARLAVQLHDLAIDAHAAEALLLQVGEQLRELALAARHHGSHDDGLRIGREGEDLVGHLVGGLLLDDAAALGAVRHAHAREQEAQVVVDLGGGAHRRARVLRRGLLVDGHRRRQAVDAVEVGLRHLAQEHARVAGQALHVAALALGVHRVERQRRLAAARQARDDHQLVARDGEVDVLEVVLAGTLDDDGVLSHVAYRSFYRSQPGAAPESNMATGELSFPCNRSF